MDKIQKIRIFGVLAFIIIVYLLYIIFIDTSTSFQGYKGQKYECSDSIYLNNTVYTNHPILVCREDTRRIAECNFENYPELTNYTTERTYFYQSIDGTNCCFHDHDNIKCVERHP